MNQQEFYNHPEVQEALEGQKQNPYNSKAHYESFLKIGELADKFGCGEDYRKSGGGIYD